MRAAPRIAALALIVATAPTMAGSRFAGRAAFGTGQAAPSLPAVPTPLPALPLATGARLMVIGDSLSNFNHVVIGTTLAGTTRYAVSSRMSGLLVTAWAANPDFNFDTWYDPSDPWMAASPNADRGMNGANQGIAGDHLDWCRPANGNGILNRVRYDLARAPQIVWINAGTNSIATGDACGRSQPADADYVIAKLDVLVRHFTARGIWVILSTLYPRGDWSDGDARHAVLRRVNDWIRAQAGRTGVRVMDAYDLLVSPTDPDGVRAGLFQEGGAGVHPNQAGAWAIQTRLGPILAEMIAPGSVFSTDPADANLLPATTALLNGGIGGGRSATVSGTVATGWSVTMARGAARAAASLESEAGYMRQAVTVTPVADDSATAYHELDITLPSLTSGLPAAGSWTRMFVHVETPLGDPQSAAAIRLAANVYAAAGLMLQPIAQFEPSSMFANPTPPRGGYWLATPPFPWPADATRLAPVVAVYFPKAAATPFTVKIDRPILRTIADPRVAWKL